MRVTLASTNNKRYRRKKRFTHFLLQHTQGTYVFIMQEKRFIRKMHTGNGVCDEKTIILTRRMKEKGAALWLYGTCADWQVRIVRLSFFAIFIRSSES